MKESSEIVSRFLYFSSIDASICFPIMRTFPDSLRALMFDHALCEALCEFSLHVLPFAILLSITLADTVLIRTWLVRHG